jgi:molecular chaperone DnaJ
VFGVEKTIELNKQISCDVCHGNGAEPGSKINNCSTCGGSGRVIRMQQTILGNFQTQATCSDCHGTGKKPEKKCSKCNGVGHIRGNEKINVIIPAGISDGQTVKISGKGDINDHSQAGDLFILIRVAANKKFVREGDNILTEAHINLKQAILGDKIEVETVDGFISLRIPEGTQSHTQFRLKDKGVTHLRQHGRGDQIVEVIVDVPKKLSRDQRKIIEKLEI